jgi:hypothetical protein
VRYEDLLQTLAELFIALVGFTGIVAVLGRRVHGEWSPIERARLESLLTSSVGGVVLALVPVVVALAGVAEGRIWRIGNGICAVLHLLAATRFTSRLGVRQSLDPMAARVTLALLPIPAALILAQLAAALGFFPDLGPFVYLATLVWVLIVGMLQFIFLLVRPNVA